MYTRKNKTNHVTSLMSKK